MEEFHSDTTPPYVVHRQSSYYGILDDDTYFPTNHQQVRDLIGRVLTQLDAMSLPERAHRAAKTLLTREVWSWWNGIYENSTTSGLGCLAPVVMNSHAVPGNDVPSSNRWGWESEDAYLARTTVRVPLSDGSAKDVYVAGLDTVNTEPWRVRQEASARVAGVRT